jgi:hypothetical protein
VANPPQLVARGVQRAGRGNARTSHPRRLELAENKKKLGAAPLVDNLASKGLSRHFVDVAALRHSAKTWPIIGPPHEQQQQRGRGALEIVWHTAHPLPAANNMQLVPLVASIARYPASDMQNNSSSSCRIPGLGQLLGYELLVVSRENPFPHLWR